MQLLIHAAWQPAGSLHACSFVPRAISIFVFHLIDPLDITAFLSAAKWNIWLTAITARCHTHRKTILMWFISMHIYDFKSIWNIKRSIGHHKHKIAECFFCILSALGVARSFLLGNRPKISICTVPRETVAPLYRVFTTYSLFYNSHITIPETAACRHWWGTAQGRETSHSVLSQGIRDAN